jgi:uncharacterized GH25 family protein
MSRDGVAVSAGAVRAVRMPSRVAVEAAGALMHGQSQPGSPAFSVVFWLAAPPQWLLSAMGSIAAQTQGTNDAVAKAKASRTGRARGPRMVIDTRLREPGRARQVKPCRQGDTMRVMRYTSALLLLLLAGRANAHDTWLLPDRFRVAKGESLGFGLTSGMDFPAPETAVAADRLLSRSFRLAERVESLTPGKADLALRLSAAAAAEGIAAVWVATRPRTLTLTPEQVDEYLAEVGATDTVGPLWRKSGQTSWRETYAKLAKTFVRVGEAADGSWAEPVGLSLELVPEADPTRLGVGDTLALRLLLDGRPLADFPVGAAPAVPGRPLLLRTDAQGRVSVRLSQPGPWMLRVTRIVPSALRAGEWDSAFTTLTLDVLPR